MKRHRLLVLLLVALLVTTGVASARGIADDTASHVMPGDILVIDSNAGKENRGVLFSVDQTTKNRTIISEFGDKAPLGAEPIAVAVSPSGNVFVLDTGADLIFQINLSTHKREIFHNLGEGDRPVFSASDLAIDASGNILVLSDSDGSTEYEEGDLIDTRGAIFRITPSGRELLRDNLGEEPSGIAVDAQGNILVTDRALEFADSGRLFFINPTNGENIGRPRNFNDPVPGCGIRDPSDLAVEASGHILIIDTAFGRLVRFDRSKNQCKSFTLPGGLSGVAIDELGNILLTDPQAGMDNRGVLFISDPSFGIRTIINDFGDSAQGDLGKDPLGVAIAPVPIPPPPPQPVDLTIDNMEITQGIQNFANQVPLVQDKTTYVRVYPKVDIADVRVRAQLRGFRGGVELPDSPLRPIYPFAFAHTGGANRARFFDSFNFWVPPAWRSGNVTFQAEINFDGAIPEIDMNNNVLSLEKTFTAKPPVCVTMIPVRTQGSRYTVDSPGFDSIIARFGSLWPIPEVNVFYQSTPISELELRLGNPFGPYELPEDTQKVLNSLLLRNSFSARRPCPAGSPFRTVGMVSPDTDTGRTVGSARPSSSVSWAKMEVTGGSWFNAPQGGVTMAHEIAHNFGGNRKWGHVDCPPTGSGRPQSINPEWPPSYPTDQIGPDLPDAFWGFDTITKAIIPPKFGKDFMSYCSPEWVSDYTWTNIFNQIKDENVATQSQEMTDELLKLNQGGEILLMGGVIAPTVNVVSFDYSYRLSQDVVNAQILGEVQSNQDATTDPADIYRLELLDSNGAVLFALPFEPIKEVETESDEQGFFLAVPFDPKTARIRITQNGQELGALNVSAHAPQVNVLQPSDGEVITDQLTIRWEASDQDGDNLFYTVQYSPDLGAGWQSLITHTPETTLTLDDTFSLPGSNQRALIRVIANDGVNTGSDTSDPFTVQRHPPVVHIDSPSNQAVFALNSQVIFIGGARDAEDGPLGGEALTWFVNSQLLGSGEEAALDGLTPGGYVITLEAVDRDGNKATASVTITIVSGMPVASDDFYRIQEDTSLTVDAPGVLGSDVDGEGDPLSVLLVSNPSNGTLTLNTDGSFTYTPSPNFSGVDSFTYRASDGAAESNLSTVAIAIDPVNDAPTANSGRPYEADEGDVIELDGSSSSDPDGDPLTFKWDFGDGNTQTGPTPTHIYIDNGIFNVGLTVTDPSGLSDADTTTATIANVSPMVDVGPDAVLFLGQTFNLKAGFTDPGVNDKPWTFTIDWGDKSSSNGSTNNQGAGAVSSLHQYSIPAVYTITICVTDKDKGEGCDNLRITVEAVVSIAAAAGGGIKPGQVKNANIGDTIKNGDFLIERTGNETTLGNGRDEDTIWSLDFTKFPNWESFRDGVDQRGLRSARLTLGLIPKGRLISTDTLRVGDLPAIGAERADGGVSPFGFPPIQELPLNTPSIVEIELLSFYTPQDILGVLRGTPEGQVPMRFGDDAIVVFAHLKLVPGCLPEEPCPALPDQPEKATP